LLTIINLFHSSDCEVSDITELAKDDDLADKLYKETLRALKIEKFH
jgi:hypothetical protein